MDHHDDDPFESTDSGIPSTYPLQCSALEKGSYVVLNGRPCKIVAIITSNAGKHGDSKVHLTGTDIFTGEKMEAIIPSAENVDVPNVVKVEFTLIEIHNGFLSLMDENGDIAADVKLPENDLGLELQEKFENGDELMVTVTSAMGEKAVFDIKTISQK